jgi:hypothetical protein
MVLLAMSDMGVMSERKAYGSEVKMIEDRTAGFPYRGATVFGLAFVFIPDSNGVT